MEDKQTSPTRYEYLLLSRHICFWRRGMRSSTGSPIFSDFKSDLSRVACFPTAGQGERRPWVRGCREPGLHPRPQSRSQSPRYPCPAERERGVPVPLDKGNVGSGNEIASSPEPQARANSKRIELPREDKNAKNIVVLGNILILFISTKRKVLLRTN